VGTGWEHDENQIKHDCSGGSLWLSLGSILLTWTWVLYLCSFIPPPSLLGALFNGVCEWFIKGDWAKLQNSEPSPIPNEACVRYLCTRGHGELMDHVGLHCCEHTRLWLKLCILVGLQHLTTRSSMDFVDKN
jgi:hypothetical protein